MPQTNNQPVSCDTRHAVHSGPLLSWVTVISPPCTKLCYGKRSTYRWFTSYKMVFHKRRTAMEYWNIDDWNIGIIGMESIFTPIYCWTVFQEMTWWFFWQTTIAIIPKYSEIVIFGMIVPTKHPWWWDQCQLATVFFGGAHVPNVQILQQTAKKCRSVCCERTALSSKLKYGWIWINTIWLWLT